MDVKFHLLLAITTSLILAGCGGGGSDGGPAPKKTPNPEPPVTPEPGPEPGPEPRVTRYQFELLADNGDCPDNRFQVQSGPDDNDDGVLNASEVMATELICAGEPAPQQNIYQLNTEEAPGANCALGGQRVDFGVDENSNAALDSGEVLDGLYDCHALTDIIESEAIFSTREDVSISSALVPPGVDSLSYSISTQPLDGELAISDDGRFTYTPALDFHGTDSFTYTASDGVHAVAQTVSIEVAAENDPPVMAEASYSLYAGSYLYRQLFSTDAEGDALSYALATPASNGTVELNGDGTFNYVPEENFTGEDSFSVRIKDGTAESEPYPIDLTVVDVPLRAVTDLRAVLTRHNQAQLSWPLDNLSSTGSYEVRYASYEITTQNWQQASLIPQSPQVSASGDSLVADIPALEQDQDYYFAIRMRNADGSVDALSNVAYVKTKTPPVLDYTPPSLLEATVEKNQSAEQAFTIGNTGGFPLDYAFSVTGESIARVVTTPLQRYMKVGKGEIDKRQGQPVTSSTGGPDAFGYRWVDSNSAEGPAFDWVDISETGTRLYDIWDDTIAGPIDIGFAFPFYGEEFEQLYVGDNGFLSFTANNSSGCCSGQPIPTADDVNHIIAWLWKDFDPYDGDIYYQTLDDGRFVVQFQNYQEFSGGGEVTAQVVLRPDGTIILQYQSLVNGLEERPLSVGIENADGTDGLQIAFNTSYLEERLAIRISRELTWLEVEPKQGAVPAGEEQQIALRYLGTETPGDHTGTLRLVHSDSTAEVVEIPLQLTITPDVTAPEAVMDLAAGGIGFDRMQLQWTAVADEGAGVQALPLERYEVRYSTETISSTNWADATEYPIAQSPASPGVPETVSVVGLQPETTYYFAIKAYDESGNSSSVSNVASGTTTTAPSAGSDTASIALELAEGRQATTSFRLSNDGGAPLVFNTQLVEPETTPLAALASQSLQASVDSGNRDVRTISAMPAEGSFEPREIIVQFKTRPEASALASLRQQYSATRVKQIPALRMEVWQLATQRDPLQVIKNLNANPAVRFAEPNYRVSLQSLPDDELFTSLWGLHNEGGTGGLSDSDIDAPEAWQIATGSKDVVVAVIDTGIDYDHPDLSANMWVNIDEVPNNGIDDDNNGFVDDVYGYNFHSDHGDPRDGNGHGTHVAGTIGAEGNNGLGVIGVNHSVSLMAAPFLGSQGSGTAGDAIEAIIYAVDNGAHILNNSWGGGGYSEALLAAIEYAHEQGVLFVVAAGNWSDDNDTMPTYPANYDVANILSVAATDHGDLLGSFSNYGATTVAIGAPGVDVLSTVPGGYDSFSGTSMASPHVAGAAALLKAHRPALTHLELKALLLESADPLVALDGVVSTGGRLNVHQALVSSGPAWIQLIGDVIGEIQPGESFEFELTVDATGLETGEHTVNLQVQTNDPALPLITVPVTLTVTPDTEPPTAVTDLMVDQVSDTEATLYFTAPGDDSMVGRASAYDVRFSSEPLTEANWNSATAATGITSPNEAGALEQFTVRGLPANQNLWLGLRAVDNVGGVAGLSNVVEITTLNAALDVSPGEVPRITLQKGEKTSIALDLTNLGDVAINAELGVDSLNAGFNAYSVQYISNDTIAKGEQDLRQGPPVTAGRGGSDEFGYLWIDSDESGGPTYHWQDIALTGTRVYGMDDDSVSEAIDIGFDFPYYGENQRQLYISSNGFIAFTRPDSSGCCVGQPLPSSDSTNHIIAWLWYDLYPGFGTVHYQNIDNERLVIQFSDYGEFSGNGLVNAQVVLHATGAVELLYKDFRDGMRNDSASVGIENADGSDGLQVVFNAAYLKDELAVLFTYHWLTTSEASVSIAPGETMQVQLNVDAGLLAAGEYESAVVIRSNDSDQPELILPVHLEVVE